MSQQRGGRVFLGRGWWVPIVVGGWAVGVATQAVWLPAWFPADALARGTVANGSEVVGGYALVVALWLATCTWRACVVTRRGLGIYRLVGRWVRVPWDSVRRVDVDRCGARLVTSNGVVTIGRGFCAWQKLAALAQARAADGSVPDAEPLRVEELAAWLGPRPFWVLSFRPLTHTLLPLLAAGTAAGAVVGYCAGWPGQTGLGIEYGIAYGNLYMLVPALLAALPLIVSVRPTGLVLYGPTRWGARRSWEQIRAISGVGTWWLVTEHEALLCPAVGPRTRRLRHAATHVLWGRRQGRLPDLHLDVPDTALSLAEPPEADAIRGISPAAESGA